MHSSHHIPHQFCEDLAARSQATPLTDAIITVDDCVVDRAHEQIGVFRVGDGPYPSLSEIATQIASSRWNGPRFFGLRGKIDKAVNNVE